MYSVFEIDRRLLTARVHLRRGRESTKNEYQIQETLPHKTFMWCPFTNDEE